MTNSHEVKGCKEMILYNLYWNNKREGIIILANISVDEMRKLINKYMENKYDDDILTFLEEKGIRVTYICGYESKSPVTILGNNIVELKLFY